MNCNERVDVRRATAYCVDSVASAFPSARWKGTFLVKNHTSREVIASTVALIVVIGFIAAILFAG